MGSIELYRNKMSLGVKEDNRHSHFPCGASYLSPNIKPNKYRGRIPNEVNNIEVKRLETLKQEFNIDVSQSGIIGKGHFAVIYRGRRTRDGKFVAIKSISRLKQDNRLLRAEIAAHMELNAHPAIVSMYNVFVGTHQVVLSMELCSGGDLYDRIAYKGRYREMDTRRHFKNIVSAVDHIHKSNIVHRDLKPENLMLVDKAHNSEIKICDFGLCKILKNEKNRMRTICGTPAYAAPEIRSKNKVGYNALVDTWSLGLILFVMLSAYHPFDPNHKSSQEDFRAKIYSLEWNFDDRREVWSQTSEEVKDLIRSLICHARFRLSASEILHHDWFRRFDAQQLPPLNTYINKALHLHKEHSQRFTMQI